MSDEAQAAAPVVVSPGRRRAYGGLIPIAFFLFALLTLGPLALCPTCVPYPPGSTFTDLLITHLPNAEYWRASLLRYGEWPLWNAQLFGGQPFAADPLAGMWYPPSLLLLLPGVPPLLIFNLLFAMHLAWAGYGLFRFLHTDPANGGLPVGPALFGGLTFAGTPKLIAHIGAGHVSLVFAVAWTPWLLLAMQRMRSPEPAGRIGGLRRGAVAGAILALTFLADVRWAFYAALLGIAFWLIGLPPFAPRRENARSLFAAVGFALVFLLLSAVLLLPLLVLVVRSNRATLTLADSATYSLPLYYLIGLLIPNLRGFQEWMTYLGVAPLLLAMLGVVVRRKWFWLTAALAATLFSLGSNFFLFPLLFRLLPGLSLLRVPPRAWFVVALSVAVLAAHGLQALLVEVLPRLKASPALPRLSRWVPSARAALPVLLALTTLDLWRVDVTLIDGRPRPPLAPAAEWIKAQSPGELFRVYSPSYSLPLDDGLQHVDGVNPLQLAASARLIAAASGVPLHGYSVTLPPFDSPDLATANAGAIPQADLLGLLNVKYVAAEFPVEAPALQLVQTFGRTRVFENLAFRPRAWMDTGTAAEVIHWSPNRVVVRADGPGLLTLSEISYPGWTLWVDGRAAPLETVHGGLRGVRLDAGPHEAVFEFRPLDVYAGLALTGLGLLMLLGVLWWRR